MHGRIYTATSQHSYMVLKFADKMNKEIKIY